MSLVIESSGNGYDIRQGVRLFAVGGYPPASTGEKIEGRQAGRVHEERLAGRPDGQMWRGNRHTQTLQCAYPDNIPQRHVLKAPYETTRTEQSATQTRLRVTNAGRANVNT